MRTDSTGTLACTSSRDRTVGIWNLETGRLKCGLAGHTEYVDAACFHPENSGLVVSCARDDWDSRIRLWDTTGYGTMVEFPEVEDDVESVLFDPSDGNHVFSISRHALKLWDIGTSAPRVLQQVPTGRDKPYFATPARMAISGQGNVLLCSYGRTRSILDPRTLETVRTHYQDSCPALWDLVACHAPYFVGATSAGYLESYDTRTLGPTRSALPHRSYVVLGGPEIWSLTFDASRNLLFSGSRFGVSIWSAARAPLFEVVDEFPSSFSHSLCCVAVDPNGSGRAASSSGGGVDFWDFSLSFKANCMTKT